MEVRVGLMGIGPLMGYPHNPQNRYGTQPSRAAPHLCPRDLSEAAPRTPKEQGMGVHNLVSHLPPPQVVPLSSCPSPGGWPCSPPASPVSHRAASQLPVPYLAVPCPLWSGGPAVSPIPSLGGSPVPSVGVALGALVSPQDGFGSRVPYRGAPCPLLGGFPIWGGPYLGVAPVPYLGVAPCGRGSLPGGEGCRLPGGGPAASRGVTLSPSVSPTWAAAAAPSVRSAGAAGAAGRQSRPASPPLPPSSSSSSTSLPPPPCLPHSPGRRKSGARVLRVPHSPSDCPTLPKVLPGGSVYPRVTHGPVGAPYALGLPPPRSAL